MRKFAFTKLGGWMYTRNRIFFAAQKFDDRLIHIISNVRANNNFNCLISSEKSYQSLY